MRRVPVLLACALALLVAVAWLAWSCGHNPSWSFLTSAAPAEWIIYPQPAFGARHSAVELPTVFRRSLILQEVPGSAQLTLRACRRFELSINGRSIPCPADAGNWKNPQAIDVSRYLAQGSNSISVIVYNGVGPPALWFSLTGPALHLNSDKSWEASCAGSVWCHARLATEPPELRAGNPLAGGERMLRSLKKVWPYGCTFLLLSFAIVAVGRRRLWRQASSLPVTDASCVQADWPRPLLVRWPWTSDPAAVCLAAIVLLWLLLFAHNINLLPRNVGFDQRGHLEYISYIQQNSALPLADQGWEMHQPPLYYLLSAALLSLFGASATSLAGTAVLRVFGLTIALGHIIIIFFTLRLLFPRQPSKQTVGLLIGGLLPTQIYLSQYVTNETLAACLMCLTLYLMLKLLSAEAPSWRLSLALGLSLGLALLAKVTALLLVPFVGGALLYVCFQRQSRAGVPPAPSAADSVSPPTVRSWGQAGRLPYFGPLTLLTIFTCLAVCGWHYWRVWRHFGTPLVTNWDPRLPHAWWQDPGYRTADYFLSFGRALTEPYLSGFYSLPDGIYSTLWGDAFWGGKLSLDSRPPWNYNLMSLAMLSALLPTGLVLIGAAVVFWKRIRRFEPSWMLLLGFAGAVMLAIVHMNLTVPSYAAAKAFYGLSAAVALCALGAAAWGWVERWPPKLRTAAAAGLTVWALATYGSFWIQSDSAATQTALGRDLLEHENLEPAISKLRHALQIDPDNIGAAKLLVSTLLRQQRLTEAAAIATSAAERHPKEPACHLSLAAAFEQQGQLGKSIEHTARAAALAPDSLEPRLQLALRVSRSGRVTEAITACREGLRLSPLDPDLHFLLASALMGEAARATATLECSGREPLWPALERSSPSPRDILEAEAINHLRLVLTLAPDTPEALGRLAWILSTDPNPALRNGGEALRAAKRACALTGDRNPVLLHALAAAYAEAGQLRLALETLDGSGKLLKSQAASPLSEQNRAMRDSFQAGKPFRICPAAVRE